MSCAKIPESRNREFLAPNREFQPAYPLREIDYVDASARPTQDLIYTKIARRFCGKLVDGPAFNNMRVSATHEGAKGANAPGESAPFELRPNLSATVNVRLGK